MDTGAIENPTRFTEVKTTLGGERKTFDCELLAESLGERVVIYRMPRDVQLEGVLLPEGSTSVGYFWAHKPYNAYHWVDDNGRTLALYFNISDQTRIGESEVAWRDLSVDVMITPDQRCRVLDEDELPDDLDDELLAYIESARDALCEDPVHLLAVFDARSAKLLAGS